MSIEIMSLVWKSDAYAGKSTQRLLLLALSDQANDQGVCWPKIETLAKKVGCSRDYAKQLVHELEQDGYVQITLRPVPGKPNLSNLYTVNIEKIREGVPQTPLGVATVPPRGGDHRPPESSLEPSIEPKTEEDGEPQNVREVFSLYENNIGLIQGEMLVNNLTEWAIKYPLLWITEAIGAAVANNARSYAYANAILERWKKDGFKSDSRPKKVEYKTSAERRQDRQRQQLIDLYNMPDEEGVIDGKPI